MKTSIVIIAPAAEPVSLSEAKAQLRYDSSDTTYDAEITRIITEARVWLEANYNISLITQTREQRQDNFYDRWPFVSSDSQWLYNLYSITLLKPPVQSITSFTYVATDGTVTTLTPTTDYLTAGMMTATDGQTDILIPKLYPANVWPPFKFVPEAIKIQYVAGFGTTSAKVPQAIKRALLMVISNMWEFRQDESLTEGGIVAKFQMNVDKIMSNFQVFQHVNINA